MSKQAIVRVVIAVVYFIVAAAWSFADVPAAAVLMSIGGAFWLALAAHEWRNTTYGSNRKAEASPQHPDPSPLTYVSWATGGSIPSFSAHSLTAHSVASSDLEPAKPALEVVESDQPILAQRAARLIFHGNSHHWASLHITGVTFGVDADARCDRQYLRYSTRHSTHRAPDIDCMCGFYAVPCDIEPWAEDGAYVTLLVELSGTIIEHEKGYRAGHQRVMECRIPPCRFCGAVAAVVDVRDNAMASACCGAHIPTAPDQVLVTLADLENLLPVPVTVAGRTDEAGAA